MDELDLQTRTNKIQRSFEFLLVAYFIARFGVTQEPGAFPEPPPVIGAGTWNEAYDFFYDAVSDGRTPTTFRRSLKNARDSFDSHLGKSGRIGWRNTDTERTPARLSTEMITVLNEYENKNEFEITSLIMKLVRGGRQYGQGQFPPKISAKLGANLSNKKGRGRRGGGGEIPTLIGKEAELWVMEYLQEILQGQNETLTHHAAKGETPGYDISYVDLSGQLQAIEVKGTVSSGFVSFDLTDNELKAANELRSNYTIWLVTNVGNNPQLFTINNPAYESDIGTITITPSSWNVRGFDIP